jgi:bifunctional UDP-N-acetylglucosamine pyrophosphorylase / glucosamine-1-phosphate N-acetyltransferase
MVRALLLPPRRGSISEPFDISVLAKKESMGTSPLAVVILAAGIGTRMRSKKPKVLHALAGRPMIGHLAASVAKLQPATVALVVGPDMEAVADAARQAAPGVSFTPVVQRDRRGTGHAVLQARRALVGHRGDVLVLLGDGPLVEPEAMKRLVAARRTSKAAVAVLAFRTPDPTPYGRMILGADDRTLERIVEGRDASDEEKRINLCNAGVIAVDGAILFDLLSKLRPDNAKGELYLTDIVQIARAQGRRCTYAEAEFVAVNSRSELAAAEALLQTRLRQAAMDGGATLIDPATVWLSYDTVIGQDVVIGPNVFFGPGVKIGDGVEIRSFCHIEGATIAPGAIIGPFARLRPGAEIGLNAHIGNFVEVKNARIGEGAKANHLAYVGDARVGARANIGAGTILCNYDGYLKHMTDIGAEVFIGSNATLVAPIKIGARAFVAAGSTVTDAVPADALAFGRARQTTKKQAGAMLRDRLKRARSAKNRPQKKKG